MSDRISEILDVIRETVPALGAGVSESRVREVRISATKQIAERRHIARETVQDKYGRQLRPDIRRVAEFDRLLHRWFATGSRELRSVLLKHTLDPGDQAAIESFFARPSSRSRIS